ncbi:MAG: 3-deoxy-manno-octulosonate cytidylyltransferase [Planctomycetota bacterium]|jgi:3-deoxy-manno-octulosonate cytidylyltransferase (CMP-KDO synthetase)
MRTAAVIPARYASKRLPGKPLLKETGKYLIQHVWERVSEAHSPDIVIVATDDSRIADAVNSFGGKVAMTSPDCPSGTDRVNAALEALDLDVDFVINIQGDEPEIDPLHIDQTAVLLDDESVDIATLAVRRKRSQGFDDPAVVKVVHDFRGNALYFSRAPIPLDREGGAREYLAHVGIYGFRREALKRFVSLGKSGLEETEKLEQLRALEAGMTIRVGIVEGAAPGIDTREDYDAFVKRCRERARGDA